MGYGMRDMAIFLRRMLGSVIALSLLGGCTIVRIPEHRRKASMWATGSGEYAAVALQTYATARERLDTAIAEPSWTACLEQLPGFEALPPAVIVDLDETVLDNRPFQLRLIQEGRDFDPEMWSRWVHEKAAGLIPGAADFLRAAKEREVEIFYITNRDHADEAVTRETLVALGLPISDERDTLLTRYERPDWGSDKVSRREWVVASHRVLLVVGDHLRDFTQVEGGTREERRRITFEHAEMWGSKWFMLPNPIYGNWAAAGRAEKPLK
jgi:acid phosphatase